MPPKRLVREWVSRLNAADIAGLFEDAERAILASGDPNGLRGYGFFHATEDQIVAHRGDLDPLSFFCSV